MLKYGFHRRDILTKEPVQIPALIPSSEVPMRIQEQPRTNMFISMLPGRHLVSGYLPLCSFYWPMRASNT